MHRRNNNDMGYYVDQHHRDDGTLIIDIRHDDDDGPTRFVVYHNGRRHDLRDAEFIDKPLDPDVLDPSLDADEYNRRVERYNAKLDARDNLAFGFLDAIANHFIDTGDYATYRAATAAAERWLARDRVGEPVSD